MYITNFLLCFKKAIERTIDHDGIEHAGYMAFMVLLAIFPFTVFFLSISSLIGETQKAIEFIEMILSSLPENITIRQTNFARQCMPD